MYSPSLRVFPFMVSVFFSSLMSASLQPATQHLPMPLATTAAWDVMPPLVVKMPCAAFIPIKSSGDVSTLTKMTFSPASFLLWASSASNTILPTAAPGEAGNPLPKTVAVLVASGSSCLCNNWSSCAGSTLNTACFSSIKPSFAISTAILTAAAAVLLPLLVCSIHNLPSSMVNSMSCMSVVCCSSLSL